MIATNPSSRLVRLIRRPVFRLAIVATVILAFYTVLYPVRGFRVPIGADTPFYIWYARYAGEAGLSAPGIAPRPAMVGILATLSTITRLPAFELASVVAPVLAATLGLAMGGLVRVSLPRVRLSVSVIALLTAVSLPLLVSGFFATLAFGAMFLAALACLVAGLNERSVWALAAAPLVLAAAGLSHPLFLGFAAGVMAVALVALIPTALRDLRRGARLLETPIARTVVAVIVAGAVALAGLWIAGGLSGEVLDYSADFARRRLGFAHVLPALFKRPLEFQWPWFTLMLAAAAFVTPVIARRIRSSGVLDGSVLFLAAMVAWVVLSLGGIALLLLGFGIPGQRLAIFCLPLPAAIGVAASTLMPRLNVRSARLTAWGDRVYVGFLLVSYVLGLGSFMAAYWFQWRTGGPSASVEMLSEARAAGRALGGTPSGTPLVLVEDSDSLPILILNANFLRATVPAARVGDVEIFVGTPSGFLAGRPSFTADAPHDALSLDYWSRVRRSLGRSPLVVVLKAADERAYRHARRLSGSTELAPGVIALPGFGPRTPVAAVRGERSDALTDPGPDRMSPWLPVWLAPAVLALLVVIGWPWAKIVLHAEHLAAQAAAAPAFGLTSLALASIVVDSVGFRLSHAGGAAAAIAAFVAGLSARALKRRLPVDRRAEPASAHLDV